MMMSKSGNTIKMNPINHVTIQTGLFCIIYVTIQILFGYYCVVS